MSPQIPTNNVAKVQLKRFSGFMHKIENDSRKKYYSSLAPVWTDCFSDLQALLSLFKYFQFFKKKFVPVNDGNIVMQPPSALPVIKLTIQPFVVNSSHELTNYKLFKTK